MTRKANARTGQYATQIIDICPKKYSSGTLPPTSQCRKFFSQFGPILALYHRDNSRKVAKRDHVFIVFKNKSAVADMKNYWAQKDTSSFWKESCVVGSGMKSCPTELMSQIRSTTGETSGSFPGHRKTDQSAFTSKSKPAEAKEDSARAPQLKNLKRKRRDQSSAADIAPEPNKRVKFSINEACSSSSNQNTLSRHADLPRSRATVKASRETPPHIPSLRRGLFSRLWAQHDNGPSANVPEVARATEAVKNAASVNTTIYEQEGELEKLRSKFERMKSKRDKVRYERNQLLVERDEARAEARKYKMERDESETYRTERNKAIEQRKAKAERCRELKREIERLKKLTREKDENSDKVLKLTIASLQRLRESGHLGPG